MDGRNPLRTTVQKPWNGGSPVTNKRDGFNSMVSFVVRIGFRSSIHVHPQIALFRMVEFGTSKTTENPKDFWRRPTVDGRNPFRTTV